MFACHSYVFKNVCINLIIFQQAVWQYTTKNCPTQFHRRSHLDESACKRHECSFVCYDLEVSVRIWDKVTLWNVKTRTSSLILLKSSARWMRVQAPDISSRLLCLGYVLSVLGIERQYEALQPRIFQNNSPEKFSRLKMGLWAKNVPSVFFCFFLSSYDFRT